MTPNPYEAPRTVGSEQQSIFPRYALEVLFLIGALCSAHLIFELRTERSAHPLIVPALVFMLPVQFCAAIGGFLGSKLSGASIGIGLALLFFGAAMYLGRMY